ncbi:MULTISPECIES: sensor histidine kinase [unclassified Curtobacterium]|uniref:sensor histidine kinase n=1 Tax=unclassified Curtobacterium TaxID=257496 RepID=UPI0008DE0B47|nr:MULTISPECIES: histidine kinase [unclassified Curtobacterium]OIH92716.1 hypothetical protein BIU92_10725 [Curtobacterium sp. MCBA15_003]OII33360.1 hypothetical protein BIU94_14785 [Curtobacterium sp. MMLR14_006]
MQGTEPGGPRRLERLWAVPVVLGALAGAVASWHSPPALVLIAVALVPWAVAGTRRTLPEWLAAVLAVGPPVVVTVLVDLNAVEFLVTSALSQFVGRRAGRGRVALAAVVGAAAPFVPAAVGWPFNEGAVYFAIGNLLAIVVGLLLAHTRTLAAELREVDARLTAARAQEDRTRLARDVHDLVAHSLTVVVLQIGGARRILRTDVDAAETALSQAELVCRESLDGVRDVVGLLRTDGDEPTRSWSLDHLVATYRDAGVEVSLVVDTDVEALPVLARGTLFRVVQEALANAARYRLPGTPVRVRIADDDGVLVGTVENERPLDGPVPSTGGYGLPGLREQVERAGGTVVSGPDGDRWLVACRLPVVADHSGAAIR